MSRKCSTGIPAAVLAYLARYTHRVAISNSRLIAAGASSVTFKYNDYRAEGPERYKIMTLAPHEFIRRFLLHVLPKEFHRIRHYGLLVNGARGEHRQGPCATRRFNCRWRTDQSLGKHWRPKICGMIVYSPRFNELQIICSSKGAKLWREEPYWSEIQAMAKNGHEHYDGYLLIVRKEGPLLAVNPFTNKTVAVRPVEWSMPQDAQRFNKADWLAGLILLGYEPVR
jgi:Putative transposase